MHSHILFCICLQLFITYHTGDWYQVPRQLWEASQRREVLVRSSPKSCASDIVKSACPYCKHRVTVNSFKPQLYIHLHLCTHSYSERHAVFAYHFCYSRGLSLPESPFDWNCVGWIIFIHTDTWGSVQQCIPSQRKSLGHWPATSQFIPITPVWHTVLLSAQAIHSIVTVTTLWRPLLHWVCICNLCLMLPCPLWPHSFPHPQ